MVWAIYLEELRYVEEDLARESEQALDSYFIRGGQGNMMVSNLNWENLIGKHMTILLNAPATIYYLYEV